jgi:hypothetical protein
VAAQEQAISTNNFKNKILNEVTDGKFRLCKQREETTDQLTSGYPILAKNEYLMRRDKVGAHTLFNMQSTRHRKDRNMVTHTLKPVGEDEDVTVVWNQGIHINREIKTNNPNIIIIIINLYTEM